MYFDTLGVHAPTNYIHQLLRQLVSLTITITSWGLATKFMMGEACEYTYGSDKAKVANAKKALKAMAIDVHEEVSDMHSGA